MRVSRALYKQLGSKRGNFVCSTYGLSIMLSLLVAGSKSSTRKEIRHAIRLGETVMESESRKKKQGMLFSIDEERPKAYELYVCNSIWIQDGFSVKSSYKQDLKDFFKAEAFNVDLKDAYAILNINEWVASKTRKKVKNVIATLPDPVSPMLLIDVVYFKMVWQELSGEVTPNLELYYHNYTQTSKLVPMVTLNGDYSYKAGARSTVVRIPYAQYCYFYIVFPHLESDLEVIEKELFQNWTDPLEQTISEKEYQITFPLFKISTTIELRAVVEAMGVHKAFRKFSSDFTPISEKPGLHVGKLYQKSIIDFGPKDLPKNLSTRKVMHVPKDALLVNHQFLFFIKHKDEDRLLLKGRVQCVN